MSTMATASMPRRRRTSIMFRGKILRMNLDGTRRNRQSVLQRRQRHHRPRLRLCLRRPQSVRRRLAGMPTAKHYEVENGPSVDRLAQINAGVNYGWNGSDASMFINAIYNWNPAHAPVNITFVQQQTFGGSQFPAGKMDHPFVSESGPTYASGARRNGKRIVEFELDAGGRGCRGPETLVEYVGTARARSSDSPPGPMGCTSPSCTKIRARVVRPRAGARIYRVRYVNPVAGRLRHRRRRRSLAIIRCGETRSAPICCWPRMGTGTASSTRLTTPYGETTWVQVCPLPAAGAYCNDCCKGGAGGRRETERECPCADAAFGDLWNSA